MLNRRHFLRLTVGGTLLTGIDALAIPFGKKPVLRFATASDGHYGEPNTPFAERHQAMVNRLNREAPDFFFLNGDIFHNDARLLPEVKKVWDGLKMPYYISHGNHDMAPEDTWQQTWGKPWHYGFEVGDCGFLVLNTADVTGKYICPDMSWVRENLPKYDHKKHLFVFMHITPVKWTQHGIDCPELVDLFSKQANLRGVFHGHDHAEDGVKEKNGKAYFFDGHIAGSWGVPYSGYRIVEVFADGEILIYQVNPDSKDAVNTFEVKG